MPKTSKQDATGPAVGYYYQGLYAILLLLEQGDDGVISVETGDDVQQDASGSVRLTQLKHSMGSPAPLNEKNDGFWKTIGFWIPSISKSHVKFAFVTCAELPPGTALHGLTDGGGAKLADAKALLDAEAERVTKSVAAARGSPGPGKEIPFAQRSAGCEAYCALTADQRLDFLSRLRIYAGAPSAKEIDSVLVDRLATYPRTIRNSLAQRILEWWDYRVARSLIGTAARDIHKEELLDKLNEVAISLCDDNLPDDFSSVEPLSVETELKTTMEKQIVLVGGGNNRIRRAAVARWRARSQRERWLSERVSLAEVLAAFDATLINSWRDRHGPMCDDCTGASDEHKQLQGRDLLDWSHLIAHNEIPPIREKWGQPFLVQGSFQELAERAEVGWHPDFLVLLASPKKEKP